MLLKWNALRFPTFGMSLCLVLASHAVTAQSKATPEDVSISHRASNGDALLAKSVGGSSAAALAQNGLKRKALERMPLSFIPNVGQMPDSTLFYTSGRRFGLSLEKGGVTLTARVPETSPATATGEGSRAGGSSMPRFPKAGDIQWRAIAAHLHFVGANADAKVEGLDATAAKFNYFVGQDPSKWKRNVPGYSRIRYKNLYPGVEMVFYGKPDGSLEYDLVVAANADPEQIRIRTSAGQKAVLDADGNLQLGGRDGQLSLGRPMLYQDVDHGRKAIVGAFVQVAENDFAFKVKGYDPKKPLIIDPTINLLYSTYLGGIHEDDVYGMAVDAEGNAYLTGRTTSQDFPSTGNAFSPVLPKITGTGIFDSYVAKFDPSGILLFSTFLGGTTANSLGEPIVVDGAGNVYAGGTTAATDFPVTQGAYQTKLGGNDDAYLAKISPDGSQLIYSTFLGGSGDEGMSKLILNSDGSLWIAGGASAAGLPASANAFQTKPNGTDNGFVGKAQFDESGKLNIPYLTFIGGSNASQEDGVRDLTTDAAGNVYATGATESSDYPVTSNAYEKPFPLSNGCTKGPAPNSVAVLTKFSPDLSQMLYSTVLGGRNESSAGGNPWYCNQAATSVHLDAQGNTWLNGQTGETDFPTTSNGISTEFNGNGDAGLDTFVAELSADGTKLLYGTYLGGSGVEIGSTSEFDASGNLWIANSTSSTNYPVTSNALQPQNAGGFDIGLTELSPDGTKVLYSTYLGGSGDESANDNSVYLKLDAAGNVHLTGATDSSNFPMTADAFQSAEAGDQDVFYTVLGSGAIGTIGPVVGGNTGDTTVTISGAGFEGGATCELVQGGTTISSVAATVNSTGTSITCTFPLNGAATGSYNVVVANPNGGSTFTSPGGFTVENSGQPDLSVSIVGRSLIRTGVPSTFYVTVANLGNENAYFTPLWITLPVGITFSVNGYTQAESSFIASSDGTTQYVSLILDSVQPGQTLTVPLQITSATDSSNISLTATLQPPWFSTAEEITAAATSPTMSSTCNASATNSYALNCLGPYLIAVSAGQRLFSSSPATIASNVAGRSTRPNDSGSGSCKTPSAFEKGEMAGYNDAKNKTQPPTPNPYWLIWIIDWTSWQIGYMTGQYNYANQQAGGGTNLAPRTVIDSGHPPSAPLLVANDGESCALPPPPPPILPPPARHSTSSGRSIDPNYKSGPSGDGSASQYVRGTAGLPYNVGFENEATAALPAAAVVVTDQLDPNKVDLTTLSLGSISFGTNFINLPSGTNNYATTYTPAGVTNYQVRIQGSLNPTTGLLKWTFQTIDPTTGLPPSDPTVGFLPPDANGVEGQGSVLFNVMPKAGQPTGTQITNTATVVFDANAPIKTPTWLNTLDVDAPVSSVAALPANEVTTAGSATFPVSWSGTDKGSGVGSYTIYVSDNGGAFTAWQSAVTATSASYTGTLGHTYGFYSIATDNAGNVEASKSKADTTTTVSNLLATKTALAASATSATVGANLTFTATVTPASGSGVPTGSVTFSDGSSKLGAGALDATGKATYATTALAAGAHSITAAYGGDTNYSGSTSSAVSVAVTAGPPDFSIGLAQTSGTVTDGGSVTSGITITPVNGFNQQVSLACTGAPAETTCSISPTTVTPSGTSPATASLTIQTDAQAAAHLRSKSLGRPGGAVALCFLSGGGLLGLVKLRLRRRALWMQFLATVVFVFGLVGATACGNPNHATPKSTYTLTVTATSGTNTHTASYSLTVQ